MVDQIIIIGGGTSIKEGITLGLWAGLQGKCTIGLNYSYKYFQSTSQMYVDDTFYIKQHEEIKDLPLVIGKKYEEYKMKTHANTIMLDTCPSYNRKLVGGVYTSSLAGLFALSLAIHFEPKEIYLLGYDYGKLSNEKDKGGRFLTHFHNIKNRGQGKVNWYECKDRDEKDFGVYREIKDIKIFNVSPNSNLRVFPKLTYPQFFDRLDVMNYNQEDLRDIMRSKCLELEGV